MTEKRAWLNIKSMVAYVTRCADAGLVKLTVFVNIDRSGDVFSRVNSDNGNLIGVQEVISEFIHEEHIKNDTSAEKGTAPYRSWTAGLEMIEQRARIRHIEAATALLSQCGLYRCYTHITHQQPFIIACTLQVLQSFRRVSVPVCSMCI